MSHRPQEQATHGNMPPGGNESALPSLQALHDEATAEQRARLLQGNAG